jgi:hypothetical protein
MYRAGILVLAAAALAGAACGEREQGTGDVPGRGVAFGTQGPWPVANVRYGAADGILESPVVGVTTDEAQNRWVATHEALYLLRPGDGAFRRYDAADGLHLPGNPALYCDDRPMRPGETCRGTRSSGEAAWPGIAVVVGGGPGEVFVGYHGVADTGVRCPPKDPTKPLTEGYGDYCDPDRHSGKIDRVRLLDDGAVEVDRFDLVAGLHGTEYWHDRTVHRLVYDHFGHPHTLYAGTNHGVTILFPDRFRYPDPGEWFDFANVEWMGDHLHARVCKPGPCPTDSEGSQRMGGWYGLAVDAKGDLWHAGKWTAGLITWVDDPAEWFQRNGRAFAIAFGDPYPVPPDAEGFANEPVFKVAAEGDPVHLTGAAVCPDGRVWFSSSGPESGTTDTLAVWSGRSFRTYDPTALGLGGRALADVACLPDGRLALAGAGGGLVLWDPVSGATRRLGSDALPHERVLALEVDRMVSPPALHVATAGGAAILRVLP